MNIENMTLLAEAGIAIGVLIGAGTTMPMLLEFLFERSKRKERIALSLEELEVKDIRAPLAGCDDLLQDIADLIDRARHPGPYSKLRVGNEILIIGPPLSGKKTLAKRIAIDAAMNRLLIVHNPRNGDALAAAKRIIQKKGHDKIMLLLPRLDLIDPKEDEELLTELDALIETATGRANVLVVGTAIHYEHGNEIDNLFGTVLPMPGTPVATPKSLQRSEEVKHMLDAVARHYLGQALKEGDQLQDMTETDFIARVLDAVTNPAEIEDITALCQTAALYRQRTRQTPTRVITPGILEKVIKRVVITEI
ncbi:MAG: hypothetical protein WDO70_03820 [Alphaproteobacteria bacterium]